MITGKSEMDNNEYLNMIKNKYGAIMLSPSEHDAARIARPWGLSPEDLHVTLLFLGDVSHMKENERDMFFDLSTKEINRHDILPLSGELYSINITNSHRDDVKTTVNANVNFRESKSVTDLRRDLISYLSKVFRNENQNLSSIWNPHLNLGYTDNYYAVVEDSLFVLGDVSFDSITISLAGEKKVLKL